MQDLNVKKKVNAITEKYYVKKITLMYKRLINEKKR